MSDQATAASLRTALTRARRLRTIAQALRQRRLLLLEGDPDWTLAAARAIARTLGGETRWIGTRDARRGIAPERARALLGSELDVLIYDTFSGFDADAFGAAAGALRGGGLLLLLTPPLDAWPAWIDPAAARIAVHPLTAADVGRRFSARLARLLASDPSVTRVGAAERSFDIPALAARPPPPAVPPALAESIAPTGARTTDQRRAIEAILATARGPVGRSLVLSAARGRGKSAALGLASAELLRQDGLRILVTAPRRGACAPVFAHAAGRSGAQGSRLRFVAPDALLREAPDADLLLVDEAAGIPLALLGRMLTRYPRIVLATTVQGYEGTGQGFAIRFLDQLRALAPDTRRIELTAPIRWARDDPVETLIDRALLLGAMPRAAASLGPLAPQRARIAEIDRERLAADEDLLAQLFGLLRLAHYQTRPADLRHLLDGPNLRVHAMFDGDNVIATAVLAREGGFEADLAERIFDGERRPRGHLLAQTLSAHGGLRQAPRLRFTRVVRVAVHPAARRRGLGLRLLRALIGQARAQGDDACGASFGASAELLAFWERAGLRPALLGSSRNAATGRHAAVVLRGLSPAGLALARQARRRCAERLPALLAGPLRAVEADVIVALLRQLPGGRARLGPEERRELQGFARHQRGFEAALPVLLKLAPGALGAALRAGVLSASQAGLFIARVCQHDDRSGSSEDTGRAARIARLREIAAVLERWA